MYLHRACGDGSPLTAFLGSVWVGSAVEATVRYKLNHTTTATLQTTTDDDDRRPRAKQDWPIRRASNKTESVGLRKA